MSTERFRVPSGRRLCGRVRVPPSKSVTHRALVLTLLGGRPIEIERPLRSTDTDVMLGALVAVGWRVDPSSVGLRLVPPTAAVVEATIDCGSAGTALRLLTGALAARPGRWRLVGSERLSERPMAPLLTALRRLGVAIDCSGKEGFAPLDIEGRVIDGGRVSLAAGESSQFLSALLVTGLVARSPLEIQVSELTSRPYVDLTLEAMRRFGGRVEVEGTRYRVEPGLKPPRRLAVDGDYSAAAYWAAGAAVTRGEVELEGLRRDSRQGDRRLLDLLAEMGATIEWNGDRSTVRGTGRLEAIDVDLSDMPDQVPTVAALAPFAAGTTRLRNVAHLRLKESDRLTAMRRELERLGVPVSEHPDGLEIAGVWSTGNPPVEPVTVDTWDDHRIAMSLAIVGLRRPGVEIREPRVVEKSYPGFWRALEGLLAP